MGRYCDGRQQYMHDLSFVFSIYASSFYGHCTFDTTTFPVCLVLCITPFVLTINNYQITNTIALLELFLACQTMPSLLPLIILNIYYSFAVPSYDGSLLPHRGDDGYPIPSYDIGAPLMTSHLKTFIISTPGCIGRCR
jgi:hypothetical protein